MYGYRGVDAAGKGVKGMQDASTGRDLKTVLRRNGVFLTEFWEVGSGGVAADGNRSKGTSIDFSGRVTSDDIATSTRQLATLTRAGIPLVDAITALVDQIDKPALKSMFTHVRDRISEGSSMSDALASFPRSFTSIYVNMVNAGEQSGTLELVLDRLAEFMEGQRKIRNTVVSALAYPALMAVIGTIIIGFMMTVVIPKISTIFEDFGQVLPWYTRLLMGLSDVMRSWIFWLLAVPLVTGGIVAFLRWKGQPEGRAKWHAMVLEFPLFGQLTLMIAMTRFARTLGTLLGSGVPVLKSLEITRHVLGNAVLEGVVDTAIVAVREGENLYKPLQASGRFPPLVSKMIAVGEQSGQLEDMLTNVARYYEDQSETRITVMTSLLEPLMIVLMGGGAVVVTLCILMPLLKIQQFAG